MKFSKLGFIVVPAIFLVGCNKIPLPFLKQVGEDVAETVIKDTVKELENPSTESAMPTSTPTALAFILDSASRAQMAAFGTDQHLPFEALE